MSVTHCVEKRSSRTTQPTEPMSPRKESLSTLSLFPIPYAPSLCMHVDSSSHTVSTVSTAVGCRTPLHDRSTIRHKQTCTRMLACAVYVYPCVLKFVVFPSMNCNSRRSINHVRCCHVRLVCLLKLATFTPNKIKTQSVP